MQAEHIEMLYQTITELNTRQVTVVDDLNEDKPAITLSSRLM